MKLSILIPAYNEEKRILNTLKKYYSFFSEKFNKEEFEIFVIINGCTDKTENVVKRFGKVRYVNIGNVNAKGEALIQGFKLADADYIGFVDADCATPPESFYELYENIGPYDGIISSRWITGAIVSPRQPLVRRIASRCFNILVRGLFGIGLRDTQCGAKLFKKDIVKDVIGEINTTRWAFDIDLLYLMKRKGCRVKEIPTVWHDDPNSKLNVKRVSIEMFLAVIRLRLFYSPFKFIVEIYNKVVGNLK